MEQTILKMLEARLKRLDAKENSHLERMMANIMEMEEDLKAHEAKEEALLERMKACYD
jgi:hypothetical protein